MDTTNIFLKNVTHLDELHDVYGSIHDGDDDDLKGIMYSISMISFINSIYVLLIIEIIQQHMLSWTNMTLCLFKLMNLSKQNSIDFSKKGFLNYSLSKGQYNT